MLITYILFLTKLQKKQTPKNGFAQLKNDITRILWTRYVHLYCSDLQSRAVTDLLIVSPVSFKFNPQSLVIPSPIPPKLPHTENPLRCSQLKHFQ